MLDRSFRLRSMQVAVGTKTLSIKKLVLTLDSFVFFIILFPVIEYICQFLPQFQPNK